MANEIGRQVWRTALKAVAQAPRFALILMIKAYRLTVSPLLGPNCRFQPTCSAYAIEALERHGVARGGWLALKRLARCHPITWLGAGHGFDPVPDVHASLAKTRTRDV